MRLPRSRPPLLDSGGGALLPVLVRRPALGLLWRDSFIDKTVLLSQERNMRAAE
jgi:hypothetical protein